MRSWIAQVLFVGGIMLVVSACASSEEWSEWLKHSSHYATGDHLMFSVRNTEGSSPRVTRGDIDEAGTQQWWGKAITVSAEQIIQQ